MSVLGTEKLVKFSNKLLQRVYAENVADFITNRDYEGEVKEAGSLKIGTLIGTAWKTYSGSVTYDDPSEVISVFAPDQKKYIAFKIKDATQYDAFIKNPKGPLMDQKVNELKLLW